MELNESTLYKLEALEEVIGDMRRRNMALMYQGLSPQERQNLQDPNYARNLALKSAGQGAIYGGIGGALGGAATAGPIGALGGAGAIGLGSAIGMGTGAYLNAKDMQKLTPQQAKIDSKEARQALGSEKSNQIQALGSAVYGKR